jgi:hypothetical protein
VRRQAFRNSGETTNATGVSDDPPDEMIGSEDD